MIGASAQPLQVRASFWQCFKAGAGFAMGAILVAVPASFILYLLWLRVMVAVISRI